MAPRTHIRRYAPILITCLALTAAGCGSSDDGGGGGGGGGGNSPSGDGMSTQKPAAPSAGAAKSTVTVKIADFKFVPDPIRVKAGGSVTWTNQDTAPHTAETAGGTAGAFNTKTLKKGDSKKVTFAKAGQFKYFCTFHRFMTGTVDVVG